MIMTLLPKHQSKNFLLNAFIATKITKPKIKTKAIEHQTRLQNLARFNA